MVVHAAGPFQRATKCTVLEAAISTKVVTSVETLDLTAILCAEHGSPDFEILLKLCVLELIISSDFKCGAYSLLCSVVDNYVILFCCAAVLCFALIVGQVWSYRLPTSMSVMTVITPNW